MRVSLADRSGIEAVTGASVAVQALYSDLKFIVAARSKSDAERKLFLEIFEREEHATLRALLSRLADHLAKQRGLAPEVIISEMAGSLE